MARKTSIEIPEEILDFLNYQLQMHPERIEVKGKITLMHSFQKLLNGFLKKEQHQFPHLNYRFPRGVSLGMLQRGFKKKPPNTASRPLRDLLVLCATQGKWDWNRLINEKFTEYFDLRDRENGLGEGGENIIGTIRIQIDHDPSKPVFPPSPHFTPRFPATESVPLTIVGFDHVWLKNEGTNPTGTHKARMAFEIILKAVQYDWGSISIISSGSAAAAIQLFINLYQLSIRLNVVMDLSTPNEISDRLVRLGAIVYFYDLSMQELKTEHIRNITNDRTTINITDRSVADIKRTQYYDWMSYEVLNMSPEYVFTPYGTGDLFVNLVSVAEREFNNRIFEHDPRFNGKPELLGKQHFFGATASDSKSIYTKLFAHFKPLSKQYQTYLDALVRNGRIGNRSEIRCAPEHFAEEAITIAKSAGIEAEPSAIAGLALFLEIKESIPSDSRILIISTGKTTYR